MVLGQKSARIAAGWSALIKRRGITRRGGESHRGRALRGETRPLEVQRRERVRTKRSQERVLANLPELRRR